MRRLLTSVRIDIIFLPFLFYFFVAFFCDIKTSYSIATGNPSQQFFRSFSRLLPKVPLL
nr:MAG TPA: hypothetical protein [Caudoviricetes sp.]DAT82977.1 MAG TPA: hypothetical protein [Caudoviricetes sp.]DAY25608.1 MAG TPA: hypothetical protein [Caudoviricetes sp.]